MKLFTTFFCALMVVYLAGCAIASPTATSTPTPQVASPTEPPTEVAAQNQPEDQLPLFELVQTISLPFIPHDIAVSPDGKLFAIELGASRVHKLDGTGNVLASWGEAGSEAGQFAFAPPPDGPPLDGGFVVVGANGNVYVSDSYNNRVQVFDANGKFLAMWEGYGDENTPFNNPGPISADAQGMIYVADFEGAHQFDRDGNYIRTLRAAGEIAFDSQGNLFTVVAFENIAMKIPPTGGEPLVWGSQGTENGQFLTPMWVVAVSDTVYISDHSGRIQQFDSEGNFLGVWSDPANGDAPLTAPNALALDAAGQLYVASKDRRTVYILQP
ncbi:MAG: SBBP repeat-containing protein [Anaerolineales bacterium]